MGTVTNMKERSEQLEINFESGLTQKFPTPKTVVAHVAYSFGICNMARELDISHGELSKILGGDSNRNLDIDLAARIMDIADSDMLADWHIEKRKSRPPEPSKAKILAQMEAMQNQMKALAAQL